MSCDRSMDRREESQAGNGNGNGVVASSRPLLASQRLRLSPNTEHVPENYDDLQLEFVPSVFSSLERYLPPSMLSISREAKVQYMREILARYSSEGERTRVQKHREYRQKIISHYQEYQLEPRLWSFSLPLVENHHTRSQEERKRIKDVTTPPKLYCR
ncbi:2-oxoglutarate and iron-dependent oxygenase domain-containing protein ICU11-like [Macadamia integrifolia]|uniref:2-oxoglutarate and iron-dependent oxygenase domain-containing protein ICU11-like n=1 Tax=Macadamia integrifolia TaxID=60698 RepID=UPI001C4F0590|nr:2-oxoglutarate and iron-dependent oxygenase domain-containing protein ICU11-like [Macadamia integrifolia]